jgi:alkylation response protein AidB-like acyl-CoA dehydrogenase
MSEAFLVRSPSDTEMGKLCGALGDFASRWQTTQDWPAESLSLCGQAGVYRWFLPTDQGGFGWSDVDQTRGYLRLAQADLTTTFIITQYMGAIRRIAGSVNPAPASRWLEDLMSGKAFGTVGISHLTTSRRHLGKPALAASERGDRFQLDGFSPWVTGAPHADVFVVGATLEDGREILAAVPSSQAGLTAGSGANLVALSASCTDRVSFDSVCVDAEMVLAGPVENVMKTGVGAGTGGLQTSTLAIGLARAAVEFLVQEAARRADLQEATDELSAEVDQLEDVLLRAVGGDESCDAANLRGQANRLVLRTTQAAMTAAKGAGFVEGHPVGRWCREALFFLVWSCPQPVAQAHLCELAGIAS